MLLQKTLESPLDSKELQDVNSKGNQPWVFIESSGAEAEAPIFWPRDTQSWLTGKDPDAKNIECRKRREWQRIKWLDGITNLMDMSWSKLGDSEA